MYATALSFIFIATQWLTSAVPIENKIPAIQAKSFNLNNKNNYVVYWGSTDGEGSLSDYCNDNIYDVIILAFAAVLDQNGVPQLYIDQCNGQDCSALVSQVQTCQNNGKTVMLSKDSNPYWVTLINELRRLTKTDPSRRYYLSGAPQCVLPDAWFGPGPQTAINEADLDFISIQFYNNYCGVQAFFRTVKYVFFFRTW